MIDDTGSLSCVGRVMHDDDSLSRLVHTLWSRPTGREGWRDSAVMDLGRVAHLELGV